MSSIGTHLENTLGVMESLTLSFSTMARISGQNFPFVTIPDYATQVAKSMPLTSATCTYLIPIVRFDQRMEWEKYAARNNTYLAPWVEESIELQSNWIGKWIGANLPSYQACTLKANDRLLGFPGTSPPTTNWISNDAIYALHGDLPYNITSYPDRFDVVLPEWQKFPVVLLEGSYPANFGKGIGRNKYLLYDRANCLSCTFYFFDVLAT
jgi:hypothetical protein